MKAALGCRPAAESRMAACWWLILHRSPRLSRRLNHSPYVRIAKALVVHAKDWGSSAHGRAHSPFFILPMPWATPLDAQIWIKAAGKPCHVWFFQIVEWLSVLFYLLFAALVYFSVSSPFCGTCGCLFCFPWMVWLDAVRNCRFLVCGSVCGCAYTCWWSEPWLQAEERSAVGCTQNLLQTHRTPCLTQSVLHRCFNI